MTLTLGGSPIHSSLHFLKVQVPPGESYTALGDGGIPVASLGIVLGGSGHACDVSTGRLQDLCPGVTLFIPAKTKLVLQSEGPDFLWVCMARSNLNYSTAEGGGRGGGSRSARDSVRGIS